MKIGCKRAINKTAAWSNLRYSGVGQLGVPIRMLLNSGEPTAFITLVSRHVVKQGREDLGTAWKFGMVNDKDKG